jgi:hypothetical protein
MSLSADGRYDHVVGIGFERDTQHRDRFSPQTAMPPNAFATLCAIARLRWSLTATTVSMIRNSVSLSCLALDQRHRVLWKAGTAEPRPSVQDFRPNPVVQPNPARDLWTLAPTFSARSAISLMMATFVGKKGVRDFSASERSDLLVTVDTAQNRKSTPRHQPHIAGASHGNMHWHLLSDDWSDDWFH